ncbi:hypothetical protein QTP88_001205 [Uroleucon formosanum]
MNSENEIRMAPGSQTTAVGNRDGAELTVVEDPVNSAFNYKFCDRKFTTKIGVGVHMSNVHKLDAIDLIMTDWSEAKLVFGGVPSSEINRELTLKLQGRTLEAIKGRRRTQEHRDRIAVFLTGLQGNPREPVAEREMTVSETDEARTEQVDDIGAEAVGDRVGTLDHLSAAESGARKAVELLSTVSEHGVQKLLTAAKCLVEESRDPNHAIAAWYIEFGKNSRASSVRKPRGWNVTEWRKNPSIVADRVLTGVDSRVDTSRASEMLKYWVLIIEGKITDNSQPQSPVSSQDGKRFVTVLEPISPKEVEASLSCVKTAPGPDGFPARL